MFFINFKFFIKAPLFQYCVVFKVDF